MKTRLRVHRLGRGPLAALIALFVMSLLPTAGTQHAAWAAAKDAKSAAKDAKKGDNKGDKQDEKKEKLGPETLAGLKFRSLGPAVTSGRIADLAVHPRDPRVWMIAVASGGVWKTTNAGTSFKPVMDGAGSYSFGCVAFAPSNPLIVWVGSGENNSQRSVGYGNGVYKSIDGGDTFENMGLKQSEHVGRIAIHPTNPDIVYVAAQGPLWGPGGDRGLYKSEDGGTTWNAVLTISENTGVSEVLLDPRDPDVLYAVAYQRRRHVWTLIDGGPEAGIHKSEDGGKTWRKLEKGLPSGQVGRIGMALSPVDPDVLYAVVEGIDDERGTYRSTNAGASWEKRNSYVSGSPQYYQELFCDPQDVDRVYSMDTYMQVTEDGGKTWKRAGENAKHVDNHVLWIDPQDPRHILNGNDGGLYESFDRCATWIFKPNLPVTQFYKVAVDNSVPFYYVYGGTQDNFTLGGPSRTVSLSGIVNSDWFVTLGGDGFQTCVDPTDPNIVYSQYQNGGLVRFDRRSGELVDIQPQSPEGGPGMRWNWDSPLIISPHSPTRLYYASQMLWRSDDRGDSWRAVSGDITRQIDRNKLKVMGKVWSIDSVAKNASTSFYGNIVSLSESPLAEGLLYVGTDDGAINVTEDGGATWRQEIRFPGIPDMTYVRDLAASLHDAGTVYAVFDNHKMADFKPYVLVSRDRGRSWASIAGDLPERGQVNCIVQDTVKPGLLFAGNEFGVYVTLDEGKKWIRMKGGLPLIQVRDAVIQTRENDLVLGTFGRGFYVLDDYTPLRHIDGPMLEQQAAVSFPVKKAWMYMESTPLGLPGKSFQGESYFTAPNPPFGATFTYYLRDELKTRKDQRREQEKEIAEKGADVPYPSWDALRTEEREDGPAVILTVRDDEGNVVRRLEGSKDAGLHRVNWDLRYPPPDPITLEAREADLFGSPIQGPMASPGTYSVSFEKRIDGVLTQLCEPQNFQCEPLGTATLAARDKQALLAFAQKTARLQRAVLGATQAADQAQSRLDHVQKAAVETPGVQPSVREQALALELRLKDLRVKLEGDRTVARRNEPTPPSISDRVGQIVSGAWSSSSAPTRSHQDNYTIAGRAFTEVLRDLQALVEVDLKRLEDQIEAAGAPWTPGRVPRWQPE